MDRAAFVVAFVERLRARGARVDLDAAGTWARALAVGLPETAGRLYWTARVCLVRRAEDLAVFDTVFATAFDGGVPGAESRSEVTSTTRVRDASRGSRDDAEGPAGGAPEGLPWATLPPTQERDEATQESPDLSPSELEARSEEPFERLSEAECAALAAWATDAARRPPRRRGRRRRPRGSGGRVALGPTLARARRTGWEPLELVRERPVRRARRVVVVCDVSGSMRAQSAAYLHLAGSLASTARAEVFTIGTRPTRLTPLLRRGTVDEAVSRATEAVADRFGGTRISAGLRELLASRHGTLLRGAVVVVFSDGWDGDPPEAMAAAMARLRRRSHRVVWANPRAAAPGFAPSTGGMSAALPYCDVVVPAHSFAALREVVEALTDAARSSTRPIPRRHRTP
ncbi:CoxE [Nocardiopsis sp. MG754419]|nr:CoxE [Nocardiopsis sp. MG754419]